MVTNTNNISSGDVSFPQITRVLSDSGASISATGPELPILLKLEVFRWMKPITVTFGNETTAISVYYVYLGDILAIVDSCTNTIMSVPLCNKKGFTVIFGNDMRCRIRYQENEIIDVSISQDVNLYYININIQDLIDIKVKEQDINELSRKKSVSKMDISQIIKLHDVMSKGHDSNHFLLACEVMKNYFKKNGHIVSIIRCDAGSIENAESVIQQLANDFSIRVESASPECQYQNPCERGIQTLAKGVGAMFCRQAYLGNKTWNLAVLAWIDVQMFVRMK